MTTAQVKIPPKLIPVFSGPARYRGAYGGRGSAKTRTFAKMAAIRAYKFAQEGQRGLVVCGREFMNSLAESSMAEVKEAIFSEPWLAANFDIGEKFIRVKRFPGEQYSRVEFAFIGLRHNLDSIKSKSRILIMWIDEAEPVSETAWTKAVPTVREHGSEIWVTWNPERKFSATHKRFRENPPKDAKIVEMNWRDNPMFPDVLEQERLEDLEKRPEQYEWIWEGGFRTVVAGAYFAKYITEAKAQKRIGRVTPDPLMTLRVFCDLGGTGKNSDNFVMWVAQFIGHEIRVLDHYEAQGQPLSVHLAWLRERGYTPQFAQIWLPHDGETNDRVIDVSFESSFKQAGYKVTVVPNQGKGAAKARIEAARRRFPSIWFNGEPCAGGLEALGAYHEKIDEDRKIGLGPDHDWSSHSADAFGLMCIVYKPPRSSAPVNYIEHVPADRSVGY